MQRISESDIQYLKLLLDGITKGTHISTSLYYSFKALTSELEETFVED